MSLKYIKDRFLEELRRSASENLDRYRSGNFDDFFTDAQYFRELQGSFDVAELKKLKEPDGDNLYDVENSIIVFKTLNNLTPMQAREERLWAYLTHFECIDYTRKRWPFRRGDDATHFKAHFFASSSRGLERDNALSRLWWMGYVADQIKDMELEEALTVLLYKTDVRAQVIERPTTSTSMNVFSAILFVLKKSFEGKKLLHDRKNFRPFMIEINSIGGVRLLDYLDVKSLTKIFEKIISTKLKLKEI